MATGILNIAFDDAVLVAEPAWTRLDDTYNVQSVTVDRGRSFELDVMSTGSATVQIIDTDGTFDPTYLGSPFSGSLDPYKQVLIQLPDSTGSNWQPIFRGYIASYQYDYHPTQRFGVCTLECVDLLDFLANVELVPDGSYGNTVTDGNIVYSEDTTLDAVQTRIELVLDEVATVQTGAGWPAGLRDIFTGNVGLLASTYAPRMTALAVILDAADAEFPFAHFFITKDGVAAFRGRYSRFNYTDSQYNVDEWYVGDADAAAASPSTVVPLSPPFRFQRDKDVVFTSAICTPQGVADSDIDANVVVDQAAAEDYGLRSWSAENLLTANGSGPTTGLAETQLIGQYVVDSYAQPRTRIGQLTIRPQAAAGTYGPATWDLLQGVELNDVAYVTVTPEWGGGFNGEAYFVEGIHYDIQPMNATHPEVTLELDVSPQAYYANHPFNEGE